MLFESATTRARSAAGRVLSTNVGRPQANSAKSTPTGISKQAVEAIDVRAPGPKHGGLGSGVVGDFIGDRKHHGGDDQAVYAVAREQLDWWGERLGRDLRNGMFGENLTTLAIDVDRSVIGTRWTVGSAVLEVTGPRIPCGTFRMHMAVRGWLKMYVEQGLSGAYLKVVTPGVIRPGDAVLVGDIPQHGVTVPTAFRAFYDDVDAMRAVVAANVLNPAEHEKIAARLGDAMTGRDESHTGAMTRDYPSAVTVDESIGIRLANDSDAPTISGWTHAPQVSRFWGGCELSVDVVSAKYTGRRAPAVVSYVITEVGQPVGYLQAWQIDGCFGLDMFISAEAQGRGIGSAAARAMAVELTARGWVPLTVDPALDNSRALRAWRAAGFVPAGGFSTEGNGRTTQIMRFGGTG